MRLDDIEVGCVAFLNPEILDENGMTCEIRGRHPFACIEAHGSRSLWVPLTSKPKFGWRTRIEIPISCKQGSPRWVETRCYIYCRTYRWWLPDWVAQEASASKSFFHEQLNGITAEGVSLIRSAIIPPE